MTKEEKFKAMTDAKDKLYQMQYYTPKADRVGLTDLHIAYSQAKTAYYGEKEYKCLGRSYRTKSTTEHDDAMHNKYR